MTAHPEVRPGPQSAMADRVSPAPQRTPHGGPARRLAWLLIGVLLGLALLLWLPHGPRGAAEPPRLADREPATALTAPSPTAPRHELDRPTATVGARDRAPIPLPMNRGTRAAMLDEDLHALAVQLLPLAAAGDAEAEYSLVEVLGACRDDLGRFADRAALDAHLLTLSQRRGIEPGRVADLNRRRFEACAGFRAAGIEPFGDRTEWLQRAAESGHPLARLAMLEHPDSTRDLAPDDLRRIRHDVVRAGLASGRPEALFETLAYEFSDTPGEDTTAVPYAVAWWLVACARGLECGPDSREWRERQAYGGMPQYEAWEDMVLYDVDASDREAARERAREILRALDAGEIDSVIPARLGEDGG